MTSIDLLPDDAESLKRRLLAREEELVAARASQAAAEAEAAHALAQVSSAEAMIAHYKLTIEKLKRALYGQRSERGERLLDQLELQLEELEAWYRRCAMFALPSEGEGFGLVLLEAMAQGAPIVSTAELGTRSILKAGCGALVVEEQMQPFAAAVIRLLQDETLRNDLSELGRNYARTWSSAIMARRLADLYESLRLSPRAERVIA